MKRFLSLLLFLLPSITYGQGPSSAQIEAAKGIVKLYTTAGLPATCAPGQRVWDTTANATKVCANDGVTWSSISFTGGTITSPILAPAADNCSAVPYSFASDATTGLCTSAAGTLQMRASGTNLLTVGPTNLTLASGQLRLPDGTHAVPGSAIPPLFIGALVSSGDDAGVLVGRNVSGANLFSHGFRDESAYASTTTGAYASFDANAVMSGALNPYNHFNAFQSRITYAGTGVLTTATAFNSAFIHQGSGTVNASYGFRIQDASVTGGGTLQNQYAVYIDTLAAGTVSNYGIYVASNPSYLGGSVLGGSTITATGLVAGSNLKSDDARNSTYLGTGTTKLGYYNTSIGYTAGAAVTESSQYNVLVGMRAGVAVTDGDENILIGGKAGEAITTGNGNIVIGWDLDTSGATSTNELNLGGLITSADMTLGWVTLRPTTFAALGAPGNGTLAYCSDCTIASPCAGSGTGALAKRLNGAWVCN